MPKSLRISRHGKVAQARSAGPARLRAQREALYDALTAAGARFSFVPHKRTTVSILVERDPQNLEIVERVLLACHDEAWRGLSQTLSTGEATLMGVYAIEVELA
jgi:hypothetical protein